MCKNNSEKTIISRNHKEISKDNNKNNSKKLHFTTFLLEPENLNNTLCRLILVVYVLKISSKSVDTETRDNYRNM